MPSITIAPTGSSLAEAVKIATTDGSKFYSSGIDIRKLNNLHISVKDPPFLAKGDNSTDDTTSIQAAIDSLTSGGSLHFPVGKYLISTQLRISTPIIIYGDGDGSDVATAGTTAGVTEIISSAVAGGFLVKSATDFNYLNGVQITDLMIDCTNVGAIGIHWSSVIRWKMDMVTCVRCTADGVLIDDANGVVTNYGNIGRYSYNAGANRDMGGPLDSNGIRFHSTYAAELGGAVQTICQNITTSVYNGDGIKFTGADNNVILKAQGFIQPNGGGNAVNFANGVFRQSRNNIIVYLAGGPVLAGSASWGNRIMGMTSETGGVEITSGGHLHYEVFDNVNGDLHKTHFYRMKDKVWISATQMFPDGGNATLAVHASRWGCIAFADAGTGRAMVNIPAPFHWYDGDVVAVELYFSTDAANTGANCIFEIELSADRVFPDSTSSADITVNSGALTVKDDIRKMHFESIATTLPFTKGDIITMRLGRLTGGAGDADGNIDLFGLNLVFEGDGPDAGSFNIPPESV